MKCYNHPEKDAIGVCKSCQKGICIDCSTIVGVSLACKDSCEEDVTFLDYMVQRNKKLYKNLGSQWIPSALINGVAGSFFLGFGLYDLDNKSSSLLIGLGIIMIIGGVLSFRQGRRVAK